MTTKAEIEAEAWKSRVLRRAFRSAPRSAHAHKMVADLAKEMSLTMYETVMSNNEVRAKWKSQHPGLGELGLQASFVKRYWLSHIAPAKAILAGMLARPEYSAMHPQIHEALLLDNTLLRGRAQGD